ncbi:sulfur oxidation c-type cytochrome SoxA [Ectothiorhodospiraceae bacterium 2226]|nr:sulfur oxidation c-type cytochrome SoxA [Ectothiorhodospiraceae bacterium 2226]
MLRKLVMALPVAALAAAFAAHAQPVEDPLEVLEGLIEQVDSDYLTQSEQNLILMADNPALWTVEDGEALFYEARGPNNVSLEECDFGKGPGVLEGAYAELPRYFEDTGRVMDLESRLVHCMITLQGFPEDDPAVSKRDGSDSDHMQLQTYIAYQSNGMPWNPPLDHPVEQAMRDAGEYIFYRRAGNMDFNCATCHTATGKRIRASVLPDKNIPEEWTKAVSWPAFRAGHDHVRSSQHRVRECLWQMRHAVPIGGSDATIALISYWTDLARGQPTVLPDVKR